MRFTYLLLVSAVLPLLLLSCDQVEQGKEVSLLKRDATLTKNLPNSKKALNFGFDLRLGPKEDVRIYLPFLRYLEKQVGQKISIRFTRSYEDTAANLGNGTLQFAAIGPVNAIIAHDKFGAGFLAMGLNVNNLPEYRAVIFTRADSDISDLTQLEGKSFVFGNKLSTQGHVLPRKMLEDAGVSLSKLGSYTFSGSHEETLRLVMNESYNAGGLQDTLARKFEEEGKIRILAESAPSPSSLICYGRDVDPKIVRQVELALLNFKPVGKDAEELYKWDRTEMPNGFTKTDEKALEEIRLLLIRYGLLKI